MDMATRLPSMTDQELATMLGNAERLSLAGTNKQKTEATRLLPLIQAEIEERKARAPAKPARRSRKTEPAAKKAEPAAKKAPAAKKVRA